MYHNAELLRVARENNFFIPQFHTLIPVCTPLLKNEMKKFDTIPIWCPLPEHLDNAVDAYKYIWHNYLLRSKVISLQEAYSRAELSTAPGYIAELLGYSTKRDFISKEWQWIFDTVKSIMQGEDPLYEFNDTAKFGPKVEVRSKEKLLQEDLEKNKQRTFCIMGCVFYLVGLMLYSEQNDALCAPNSEGSSKSFWSLVGFNPFYGGFNNLAAKMQRNGGKKFFCLDIKGQEASITPKFQLRIYEDIRNPYLFIDPDPDVTHLLPRNDVELENLKNWYLRNLIFTYIVDVTGGAGVKLGTNPSGGNNTLQDNQTSQELAGLYHLSRYEKTRTDKTISVVDLAAWYHKLAVSMMADDSMFEDHPIWKGVEDSYQHLNFKTTNECGPPGTTVTISDAKIMNNTFAWINNRQMYVAQPNFDKLMAGVFYYRKSNSWRLTYAKLCAIRTLVYPFKVHLREVEHYIFYIEQNHWTEMQYQETWLEEKIPFSTLHKLKLADRDLEFLHYVQEISGGHNNIPEINTFNERVIEALALSQDGYRQEENQFC